MNQDTGETRELTESEKQLEAAQLAAVLQQTNEVPVSEAVKDMVDVGRLAMNRVQRRAQRFQRR